jgi:hypothetical protein
VLLLLAHQLAEPLPNVGLNVIQTVLLAYLATGPQRAARGRDRRNR